MTVKGYLAILSILVLFFDAQIVFASSAQAVWSGEVRPVDNQEYRDECGACHFAYHPGLLPARSWKQIMLNLQNHFGEDADIDNAIKARLLKYLSEFGAIENSPYGRERIIAKSLSSNDVPARITDLKYIKHEHEDLTRKMVVDNVKVKSLANCNVCHTTITSGSFAEDKIVIPGHGAWED